MSGREPVGQGDGQGWKERSTAPGTFHHEVSSFAGAGMPWRGIGARPALELGGGQTLGLSLLPAVSCDHSGASETESRTWQGLRLTHSLKYKVKLCRPFYQPRALVFLE